MRSISRVTSRARQVGTVTSHSACDLEPESSRVPFSGRRGAPRDRSRAPLARVGTGRPAATAARRERRPGPVISAPARSTIIRLARTAAGSARYGSTPFSQRFDPAVRSASRSEVLRIPSGSKFAASSRTSVVVSETSLSSPPMIAARATARSPSAMTSSASSSRRSTPSRVRSSSPGRARRTTIRPPESLGCGRTRAMGCPHVHHVVRHVDDVRDRAHVGEVKARPAATAGRARSHVAEGAADVARATREVLHGDVDGLRVDDRRILDLRGDGGRRRGAQPPPGRSRPSRAGRRG